ncbi:MAG: response regulator transcription factor [Chloroflexi bacterium]|nr:response regulator transcription factor [Chloroflexota bacterium]
MRILVIDDERAFSRTLCRHLERRGFETFAAYSGGEGLSLAQEIEPDLVIVDIRLPDIDGGQVCRQLRALSDVPLIVLSGYGKEPMVRATEEAADLWVVKPVSPRELEARMLALLRRSRHTETSVPIYNDGFLYIDPVRRLVRRDGERIELTGKEFELLNTLLEHRNQIISHETLMNTLWPGQRHAAQYLPQYISRLRQKLERDPGRPFYIRTAHGEGYWFCGRGGGQLAVHNENNA